MEYRQLGSAGVRVSVIGLGTNRFGVAPLQQTEVNRVIDAALDLGINFIDAANTYTQGRAEETLGQALKGRWEKFVVASKFVLPVGQGPMSRASTQNDQKLSRIQLVLNSSKRRASTETTRSPASPRNMGTARVPRNMRNTR